MARRYFASPWVEAQRARLQRLVDCAASSASSEPPRALDVGCGRGRHSLMLLEMGFQVTAVDLDGEALDTLRQRERGAVEKGTLKIRSMDLEAEDVGALGHFDVLLVVNYASRSLLPKLLQLLKPKGLLIFESWAQGNEHFATPKDAEAQRRLLRANELLEATSDCFTVLAYSHGLQEDYEGRDCVKQMICAEKRPCPGRASPVSEASRWCLGRLLEVTDASFLQDSAFGRDWVWHRPQSLGVAFGIEDLLQLLDGYDPEAAQKEYLAALTSASPRGARPALWDVSMVRRRESTTETLKPQEVRDFLRAAQLKTSADVLQRGEGWTLVVSQLQGAPALCDLHQRLFAATGLSSGINAYLTPPDAIGKPPHVDDHDVLVLQLAGSKTWTLLDDARQTIREQVPLTKGDVMYLPQGIPHHAAAMASHEASLHLAVALHRRPMSYSSVLGALVTLRLMDPGDGDLLPAALVEEMEGRSQSFAAFGAREHWINQLLPMHLALVRALSPEDLDVGLRREFCAVLRQRSRDLAELLRSPDMEDADLGMPVGARRQRALLRASVRGSERDLEEAAQLPEEDFEALACAAFWVRREYVMEQHFRQSGPSGPCSALLSRQHLRLNGRHWRVKGADSTGRPSEAYPAGDPKKKKNKMALEEGIRHKSGPLKQQNKTHKHGRHRSKSEVDKTNKGRVGIKVISKKVRQAVGKTNRRHQAKQIRDKRREEVLEQKRKTGKQGSPPHLIAIVPLSSNCDVDQALKLLTECDSDGSLCSTRNTTTLVSQQLKQRFSFLPLKYGDLFAVLDAAKVSDSLLFLLNATHPLDSFGDKCLSCIFAQGLPTSFLGVQGLEEVPSKKRNDVKKHIQKIVEKRFPRDKIHNLESSQDALVALRLISNQHQRVVHFRDIRPHLLAESTTFEPNSEVTDVPRGTLKVCGFVRGKNLSVNRLVHLPGYGDFQMSQIDAPADPFPWQKRKKSSGFRGESMAVDTEEGTTSMDEDIKLIARADIAFQESLQSVVEPDPMEGEQTWPTDEELREAEEARQEKKVVKRVPKGTSDYQAAWITNSDDEEGPDDDDNDEDDDEFEEEMEGSDSDDSMRNEDEEYETVSVAATETEDSKYDEDIDVDEERGQLEKMRAERENEMFPDEMDTPMDQPARVRFQRYRGLKSFRTSPWDPKENLPSDYARIFQFENFKRTKKRVMEEDEVDGAQPGWYVTVHISNVPRAFMDSLDPSSPLVIFGLLPHEQKMSVVHFVLKRHPTFSEPVRSKERLIFHCGFRRFTACPVFSQHTSGDKHKLERFMPQEGAFVATLYAPIMFPPAPVLVFTQDNHTSCHTLVGTGSLYKVDPDRIVAKKIVLSGHPFKINKRSVVLRYMFFNREDIHWFKPVELFTKYGRRGHIREPLGTHGHMKCVFDGMIKAQDTVCMNLYKRIFPKWTYEPAILPPPVETPKDIEDAMET